MLLLGIPGFAESQFIYINVGAFENNKVVGFAVAQDGTLTNLQNSPFFTGGTSTLTNFLGPTRLVVSPTANLLFVSNTGTNDVSAFTINPMTGNLSPISGSPFQTGGIGDLGISLAISPDGQFLFAANPGSHTITVFHVGLDGSLLPIPNSPFNIEGEAVNLKVSPNGRFLAASIVSFPNRLLIMNIAADGSLSPAPGSPLELANRRPTVLEMNCESNLLFVLEGIFTPV
jgi:6-phosphogluconolactonase (cycloisomerase 2 family)